MLISYAKFVRTVQRYEEPSGKLCAKPIRRTFHYSGLCTSPTLVR